MTRFAGPLAAENHGMAYDVLIVGSGPAGSMVASRVAAAGYSVAVVEEGDWAAPEDFPLDHSTATARYYRDHGLSTMLGAPPTPYLQGRVVGGTSVINGAISWRMPENVYRDWLATDPGLERHLPWDELMRQTDEVERRLNIQPTDPAIEGRKNSLMGVGAEALGIEHRPINRNVRDCRGSGRCMQGCPHGAKMSMDRTYLVDAESAGADIYSSVRVTRIGARSGRADRLDCVAAGRRKFTLHARRAVVLAASAIGTPVLLLRSGFKIGPVGHNFCCHPGTSVAGRFGEPVFMWEGATQGHEVIGLRNEGLKFEALGFDLSVLGGRLAGVGEELMHNFAHMHREADWGVAVKSTARGRVQALAGNPIVRWEPGAFDMLRFRRGVAVLGRLMLAAGAEHVFLGVRDWQTPVTSLAEIDRFETQGPLNPKAYLMVATHLFGTCRIGTDPTTSVIGPRFEHHAVNGLYIADSSVFPSNTGVNPQTSILALAAVCARRIIENLSD